MSNSSPDVQPVRDNNPTSSSYPADIQGFFTGWCEAKRYTVQEVIGKGSYGIVCAAVDTSTGEKVAIKKIQSVFDNVADATRILREIKLLRALKHADVVEIKHILLPPDPRTFKDIYVVFELMESDLHTVIGANDDLTHDHHKVFLYQLLRGLAYIHGKGVLHRDLKPKNILANSNCKLKICDFGLARPFLSDTALSPVLWTDYVATRWYRAPELCGCFYGRYSQAVDIWSIGCIFAEVLLGKPLFPGRDAVSQLNLVTDLLGKPAPEVIERISNQRARDFFHKMPHKDPRPFETVFKNADRRALDLLKRLIAFDPSDRPTAAEALADPYFAGLPNATSQEATPVSRQQFEFEAAQKLTEADVRALIYQEVLHYHPAVQAAYAANSLRSAHYAPITAPGCDVDIKKAFLMAEHYGSGTGGTTAVPPMGALPKEAWYTQQQQPQGPAPQPQQPQPAPQQAGCQQQGVQYGMPGSHPAPPLPSQLQYSAAAAAAAAAMPSVVQQQQQYLASMAAAAAAAQQQQPHQYQVMAAAAAAAAGAPDLSRLTPQQIALYQEALYQQQLLHAQNQAAAAQAAAAQAAMAAAAAAAAAAAHTGGTLPMGHMPMYSLDPPAGPS